MTDHDGETLLEFPCEFPVKAFGQSSDGFPFTVFAIVQRHVPDITADAIQCRRSEGGKYDAVTISFTATSKRQLDAIYQDLTACPAVIMVL
jgi:putative lipoic acid-binding regulatory protein